MRTRFGAFLKMVEIIPANTKNIFARLRNRREQLDSVQLDALALVTFYQCRNRRQPGLARFDQGHHIGWIERQVLARTLCDIADIQRALRIEQYTSTGKTTAFGLKSDQPHDEFLFSVYR